MNYPSLNKPSEWPKYFSTRCPKCHEWVERGDMHICDRNENDVKERPNAR